MGTGSVALEINLNAIAHNFRIIRKIAGEHCAVTGIVKTDAYGHGMIPVAKCLLKERVDALGVGLFDEAMELRANNIPGQILIMCGISNVREAREAVLQSLTVTLLCNADAKILDRECKNIGSKCRVFIKVDTGMGRLGFTVPEFNDFMNEARHYKNLEIIGLMSHFSSADEIDTGFTKNQIKKFTDAISVARKHKIPCKINSLANSAGFMLHPGSRMEYARIGIAIYGGNDFKDIDFLPAMKFSARVIQVKEIPAGSAVSYGRKWTAGSASKIAMISAGYGNGIPRQMSNKGRVLINGTFAPVIGAICMGITICDVTHIPDISIGDKAVFLGEQGSSKITASDMAAWADTISYDILCSIGQCNSKSRMYLYEK